jgi:hypothetical protein
LFCFVLFCFFVGFFGGVFVEFAIDLLLHTCLWYLHSTYI